MRAVLLPLLLATPALAQPAAETRDGDARLKAYLDSAPYHAVVQRGVASVQAGYPRCPAMKTGTSRLQILQPVAFAAGPAPVAGVWRQSFPVSGCGADSVLNVFFFATPSGVVPNPGAPGTTLTDATSQREIWPALLARVQTASGCASFTVATTRIDGPSPTETERSWREAWVLTGCGKRWEVPLEIRTTAAGTTLTPGMAHPADNS